MRRIVYLSGLHPEGELSAHLGSRVEVGEILLASGVPTAVLQAGVVLGAGLVRHAAAPDDSTYEALTDEYHDMYKVK